MKTLVTTFLTVLLAVFTYSQDFSQEDTYFAHLYEINKEWQFHKHVCPDGTVKFNSDQQRIQLHLKLVCNTLKNETPQGLSDSQLSNRLQLIHDLELYADGGVFPTNLYHNVRQPYFVDDYGVHCAVGYMMHKSGNDDLVARIVDEHNYDYIRDIETDGVTDWANEYGFKLEELKWIQPSYAPPDNVDMVGAGTNGPVNGLVYDNTNAQQRVLIFGSFTELDSMPCLNLGQYKNGQLDCIGSGLDGLIVDIYTNPNENEIYAFGEIFYNSNTYFGAVFNGNTDSWSYLSIPNRDNAHCTAAYYNGGHNPKMHIALTHSSNPTGQELWRYQDANWELLGEIDGEAYDMKYYNSGIAFGGKFSLVTPYYNGLPQTSDPADNAGLIDFGGYPSGITGDLPDTIFAIEEVGSAIYFAGSSHDYNHPCMSNYLNGVVQPQILYGHLTNLGSDTCSINTLLYKNGSSNLIIGGDFFSQSWTSFGRNLAAYSLVYNSVYPMANFDDDVNGVAYINDDLYIGGNFTYNNFSTSVNHLGRITSTSSIGDPIADLEIKLYPNPFADYIQTGDVENGSYRLLSMSGKVIKKGDFNNHKIQDLSDVPKGTFILMIEAKEGLFKSKVVK